MFSSLISYDGLLVVQGLSTAATGGFNSGRGKERLFLLPLIV